MDRRTFIGMLSAAGVTVGFAGPAGPLPSAARAATTVTTAAGEDPAAGRAPHQPYMHGYDAKALKNWSPETDRFAKYFRSRVPLATRIPPFAATQADPRRPTAARVMNLSFDYDKSFFAAHKYNDVFARRLLRFWQYTDIYGSWHGMPVDGSPTDEPVHGVVNLPNPAYTDAAHRNGARSLGCWFWPRDGDFDDYLERRADGSFPVADKLIEMAGYFGFDGYFVNQEDDTPAPEAARLMELLKYLRSRAPEGFHIQWYDTILANGKLDYQNQLNERNAPWIQDEGTPVAHSIFPNYWLPDAQQVITSRKTAERLGLDPYEAVYHGTETEKYGYNPPYDTRLVFPEGERARTSWALFGSHFPWDRHPDREDPDAQDEVFQRERWYWSGPNEDPTRTGRTRTPPAPAVRSTSRGRRRTRGSRATRTTTGSGTGSPVTSRNVR
ncbi:endo-beta-N-acetylglucosaminidase [Streptomyces oceani]|uniref:endo-beta-N-acetylglucosaminidase n=1 Tax=Streptomyces oceani TaxID=1075402 RepID=UPI00087212A6|nr:twin-arginine translocation signal domain-containing protein [Streptomyces oceani]